MSYLPFSREVISITSLQVKDLDNPVQTELSVNEENKCLISLWIILAAFVHNSKG